MRSALSTTIAYALLSVCVAARANAYPHHRRLAIQTYSVAIGCELCHAGPSSTERNAYGRAWHDRGENVGAFEGLAKLDSDSDGASNIDEIRALSNPSDDRSTPSDPGKYAKRAKQTPIPHEQLELVADHVQRFDVIEPAFDQLQIKRLETNLGRDLTASERMPTIYLAVRNNKPEEAIIFGQSGRGSKSVAILVAAGIDGKVHKIALYRGAGRDAARVQAYIRCYSGLGLDDIRIDTPIACAMSAPAVAADLSTAVRDALATLIAAFGR